MNLGTKIHLTVFVCMVLGLTSMGMISVYNSSHKIGYLFVDHSKLTSRITNESKKLMNAIATADYGEVVHLRTHIKRKGMDVCVLTPYSAWLSEDDHSDAADINQEILEHFRFHGEKYWYLVFWNGKSIDKGDILPFITGRARLSPYQLDYHNDAEFNLVMRRQASTLFADNKFRPAACSPIEKLAAVKYRLLDEQNYLTFGVSEK